MPETPFLGHTPAASQWAIVLAHRPNQVGLRGLTSGEGGAVRRGGCGQGCYGSRRGRSSLWLELKNEGSGPVAVLVERAVPSCRGELTRPAGNCQHLMRRRCVDEGERDCPAVGQLHDAAAVRQTRLVDHDTASDLVADRLGALLELVV